MLIGEELRRGRPGATTWIPGEGRLQGVAAPPSVWFFTRPGCRRSLPRYCPCRPELWEGALGAVGGGTRRVARVVRRVAGHRSAVATSYLVRFFTPSRCGRGHSACCPGRLACCRAPVGRCRVVLGTFLHAVGVWEGALDVLPGSSGVLPGSPWLLPDRSRMFPVSSRQLPAPVL